MKYILFRLKRFCGFITGFVFFIAGIFKLLDPVGTGLIMTGYFGFLHLDFLEPAAKPIGVAFALLEAIIGAALVTGIWRKVTAVAALIFQGFFTILTLFLVIFNPEMDCGCFGEVIHLTHWETFIKNLILSGLLIAFTFPVKHLGWPKKHKYVSFAIVTISTLIFAAYSLLYIPLVDYTAFRPATPLAAGSAFETTQDEVYEAVFTYEKDGVQQDFPLTDLPDSTWTFVDTKTVMKSGFKDSTVSLSFYDEQGEYKDTLAAEGKVMVLSIYEPDIRERKWKEIAAFTSNAEKHGFRCLILVSSTPEIRESAFASMPEVASLLKGRIFYSDYKTLISLNRSNGGVTYFSDGYLIRKWAERGRPDFEELKEISTGDDTEVIIGTATNSSITFQAFILYVLAVMLLL